MTRLNWKIIILTCLAVITSTAPSGWGVTLLYDHEFEGGNTSGFDRTVPPGEAVFTGSESQRIRKGRYSARMHLTLLEQRAYVEEVLDMPYPELYVKCAVMLGNGLEVVSQGEILSLTGATSRTPAVSVVLERDLTLSLAYFDASDRLVSVPTAGNAEPLRRDEWYEIEVHFRSMFHAKGPVLELFLDGVSLLSLKPVSTQGLVTSATYGQRMEWLEGTKAQGTVYFDLCKGSADGPIGQEPDKMAAVLVDRSDGRKEAYANYASERVKGFLDHLRLPYLELDVSHIEVCSSLLKQFDLLILGQEGLGDNLTQEEQEAIADAVAEGVGLLSFDPWLNKYASAAFQEMMGDLQWSGFGLPTWLEVPETLHFITRDQPPESGRRKYEWNGDIPQLILTDLGRNELLAVTDKGPAFVACDYGKGRVCAWLLSSILWDDQLEWPGLRYLGHLNGTDDLVWRGLVWASRKPMAWRPLNESYLALKIDDCRGRGFGGTPFQYLDMASSAFGVKIQASLFLDAIGGSEARNLRSLAGQGKVGVSAHAFDGGDTDPNELSEWHIYWDYPNDRPFTPEQLEERWAEVDNFFSMSGLSFSPVFAPSFGVAGIGNVPYLIDHGIDFVNTLNDFGTAGGTAENAWKTSLPFHNGAHALDFMGAGYGPFNVSSWADFFFYSFDFLVKYNTFPYEAVADPEEAFENARRQIEWAHAARFPMVLLTHEYLLAVAGFTLDDWGQFIDRLKTWTDEKGITLTSFPEMARIARNHVKSRILSYDKGASGMVLLLAGDTDGPTGVELWHGNQEPVHISVPAFESSHSVRVALSEPASSPGEGGGCGCAHFKGAAGSLDSLFWVGFFLPMVMVWSWLRLMLYRHTCPLSSMKTVV